LAVGGETKFYIRDALMIREDRPAEDPCGPLGKKFRRHPKGTPRRIAEQLFRDQKYRRQCRERYWNGGLNGKGLRGAR